VIASTRASIFAQQEVGEVPGERLFQLRDLGFQPATRERGQGLRIAFTGDQGACQMVCVRVELTPCGRLLRELSCRSEN